MISSIAGRPCVISVAGFDPSGGAGVLADCKTFETLKTCGFGVVSALTFQSDTEFKGVNWVSLGDIEAQLEPLAKRFDIGFAKIGLIQDLGVLHSVVNLLRRFWPRINITWDPIAAASAGFTFHKEMDPAKLTKALSGVSLVTPNLEEISLLAKGATARDAAVSLSQSVPVLLKGGHGGGFTVTDALFERGEEKSFTSSRLTNVKKHGSGCVLSAALVAFQARGFTLREAIPEARAYIQKFLTSSEGLLGVHS